MSDKSAKILDQNNESFPDIESDEAKIPEVKPEIEKQSLKMNEFKFAGEKIRKPESEKRGVHRELEFGQFVGWMMAILILGLIFLGGLYFFVNADTLLNGAKYQNPVTTEPISLYLEVGTPENDTLSSASTIVVSGKTIPDGVVAIVGPSHDEIFSANALGEFSKVFGLDKGQNPIMISAFDNKGNSKTEMVNVYFTTDEVDKDK